MKTRCTMRRKPYAIRYTSGDEMVTAIIHTDDIEEAMKELKDADLLNSVSYSSEPGIVSDARALIDKVRCNK